MMWVGMAGWSALELIPYCTRDRQKLFSNRSAPDVRYV
jgi:hypothetical protein